MTKLTKEHLFKAGARLARGGYTRGQIAGTWGSELSSLQVRQVLVGFDAEAKLIKQAGSVSARSNRKLGKA